MSCIPSQSFPFLDLSRELRDQIYEHILDTPRASPPLTPSDAKDRIRESPDASVFCDEAIFYEPKTPVPASSALLCTSRQISHEMREAISRRRARSEGGLRCVLDLMVSEKGDRLWPTWVSVPAPLREWQTLVVNIRFFDTPERWWGCGGPADIGRHFLRLLGQFLQYGSSFRYNGVYLPKVRLDTLVLDIESTSVEGLAGQDPVIGPERQKKIVSQQFQGVCSYIDRTWYTGVLYGRINVVMVRCGGSAKKYEIKQVSETLRSEEERDWAGYGWIPGRFSKVA